MNNKKYIGLENLEVYQIAREMSKLGWKIYEKFDWQIKKVIGDQFIRAIDSTGANIAEGYGRYHYLDRIKFFYNARGSLLESQHWSELIKERNLAEEKDLSSLLELIKKLHPKLNNFIKANFKTKNGKQEKFS